ncbi:MAG TPA: hypothetical protein VFK38_09150, partial [Candidatus Limnocylindrales bacterium]|nr:hypothetical protein [Candidatus Limnocylindrales bacterium]
FGLASAGVTVARMVGMAVGLAALTAFGSERIEALSVVLRDQAARDAILPEALRGRPLQDGLVVEELERWAAHQAAGILGALFALAAVVTLLAVLPALALRRAGLAPGAALVQTAADGTDGDADDTARGIAAEGLGG